ncbi:MAG: hypothetical protein COB08_011835 [Rhodobacteraceae bacterium]|nr:hypothetical protein [Paracoccaceae bacterium]
MSESESFIEEVSDEVRRDKLFKLFKKYGWILGLVVLVIVGGTAYNEWNKSTQETAARLSGDLMLAARATGNAEALSTLTAGEAPLAVLAKFERANLLLDGGDTAGALDALRAVTTDMSAPLIYADLAWLKIVMLDGANMPENERNGAYERLMVQGAPYRLLAQEQLAMQYVRDGDIEAAKTELAAILVDPSVTPGLRSRAQQLMVALGGDTEADTANG